MDQTTLSIIWSLKADLMKKRFNEPKVYIHL